MSGNSDATSTIRLRPQGNPLNPMAGNPAGIAEFLPASQRLLQMVTPGSQIGSYTIGDRIGLGGMGVVHEALHYDTGKQVALKFLISASDEKNEQHLARFQAEAKIIQQLQHSAIVKVTDAGSHGALHFMAMELFLGPYGTPVNLNDYANNFGDANGVLDENDTRQIMLVLLEAIGYAHRHGVVHCDIKPSNILFNSLGMEGDMWNAHLKLTDFGIAKVVGEDLVHQSVTQSLNRVSVGGAMTADAMALLGTYDYMSPEQRRGDTATFSSDIYAVGMMVFRFLTGKTELGLKKPSRLMPGLNPAWDTVILKALNEDPERRYKSAREMASALEHMPGI